MQHGAAPSGSVSVVTGAPLSSDQIARVQPVATLRSDDFDSPAPIAVAEAAKAAGGHSMHGMKPEKKDER
jgi:hypothetical protein